MIAPFRSQSHSANNRKKMSTIPQAEVNDRGRQIILQMLSEQNLCRLWRKGRSGGGNVTGASEARVVRKNLSSRTKWLYSSLDL